MELRTEVFLPYPPAEVFAACRDDVAELVPYLPDIVSIDVRSREERGSRVDVVVDWCAGGDVPAALRAVLGTWAFAWTDHASWDAESLSVEWRTVTRALGDALSCGARDVFLPDGAGGTILQVVGALEVDGKRLPAVPALIGSALAPRLEAYLALRVEASLAQTARALTAYLTARSAKSA